jgi:hypothetical protein
MTYLVFTEPVSTASMPLCPARTTTVGCGRGEYHSKSGTPVEILPPLVTIKLPVSGLEQPQLVVLPPCQARLGPVALRQLALVQPLPREPAILEKQPGWKDCWGYRPIASETVYNIIPIHAWGEGVPGGSKSHL